MDGRIVKPAPLVGVKSVYKLKGVKIVKAIDENGKIHTMVLRRYNRPKGA
jgi:hypothetical protein